MGIASTVRWFNSEMVNAPVMDASPSSIINLLKACLIDGFDPKSVFSLTVSNEVATVSISVGHDYQKHAVIRIIGATPGSLNGDWRVKTVVGDTFTFDCPGIADVNATGTISAIRATPGYWEIAFSGTDKAAFRSTHPNGTGLYLRIDEATTGVSGCYVRCYESMTDVDTGINPFPTFTQWAENAYRFIRTTVATIGARQWFILADDRLFYLFIRSTLTVSYRYEVFVFGDIISYLPVDDFACHIFASTGPANPAYPGHHVQFPSFSSLTGSYLARNYTNDLSTPTLVSKQGLSPNNHACNGPLFPHSRTGGYYFSSPVRIIEGTTLSSMPRGDMPGLLQSHTDRLNTLVELDLVILEPSEAYPYAILGLGTHVSTTVYPTFFNLSGPWRDD